MMMIFLWTLLTVLSFPVSPSESLESLESLESWDSVTSLAVRSSRRIIYDMKCEYCGLAIKGKTIKGNWSLYPEDLIKPKNPKKMGQHRIVDGYEPHPRPWMVYIQLKAKDPRDTRIGRCAGSIINKRWILTAGHCLCESLPCKTDGKDGSLSVKYKVSKYIRLIVGLKDLNVIDRYPKQRLTPYKGVIHPK
jgi:hypothetical protein